MSNAGGNDPDDQSNHALLEELFGLSKPVIAMMHLLPLPGRPLYDSDMGLLQPDAAATLDYRRHIGAENVRLFFNIEPEFARPLSPRPFGALAHSVVVSSLADAILISGAMAGAEANLDHIREAKVAVPNTPVLANTGVKVETVRATLAVADGVIVGTGLKHDGYTWNPVDAERVRRFMDEVRVARAQSEN